MRRLAALSIIVAFAIVGCKQKPKPLSVEIAPNTEIPLMLAKKLEAGTDAQGTIVSFIVSENVTSPDGKVAIPKGSVGYGMVMRSRSEGTLSSMLNKPARLEVRLDYVLAKDGQQIALCAQKDAPTEPYSFSRENTGNIEGLQNLDRAWDDSEKQKQLVELVRLVSESKYSDMANNPETDQVLNKISTDLDLKYGKLEKDGRDRVSSILGSIGSGQVDPSRLSVAAIPEVAAVIELAKLTGKVGQRIGGALKGRTIRAYVGTPLKAYTVKAQTVVLKPEE